MFLLLGLLCSGYPIFRLRIIRRFGHVNNFTQVLDNQEVVVFQAKIQMVEHKNFWSLKLECTEKKSNRILTIIVYVDVRTLGSGVVLLGMIYLFCKYVCAVVELVCQQVAHLRLLLSDVAFIFDLLFILLCFKIKHFSKQYVTLSEY